MKKLAILSLVLAAGAAMAAEPGSYEPMTTAGAGTQTSAQARVSQAPRTETGEVGAFNFRTSAGMSRDTSSVRAEGAWASRANQTFGEV